MEDFSPEELEWLLDVASGFKKEKLDHRPWKDKSVALIFFKSSTRTRVSFETAVVHLGGHPIFLNSRDIQFGRGETIEDTGRALSKYVDGIVIRTFAHSDVTTLAQLFPGPVINGLTDFNHPCQIMADLLTIQEEFGSLKKTVLAYVGDGNNVANSLVSAAKLGLEVRVASPEGYEVKPEVRKSAPANVHFTRDPLEAVAGADVVYTDTFVSMGEEAEAEIRHRALGPYQVNETLMARAAKKAIFLHCLPAHRGEEVSAEVIDGSRSRIWPQAENRLHVQKAILATLAHHED